MGGYRHFLLDFMRRAAPWGGGSAGAGGVGPSPASDAERRSRPCRPCGRCGVAGGWHAIDDHTVLECVVSPVGHLQDVPPSLRADWARANVDVFAEIGRAQEAQDEVALERALKWYLVLHDVLLRGLQRGTRGSGRMANALATRFRLWREERRLVLKRVRHSDLSNDSLHDFFDFFATSGGFAGGSTHDIATAVLRCLWLQLHGSFVGRDD